MPQKYLDLMTSNHQPQAIYLNASTSVDDDGIDSLPMVYTWHCAEESTGSTCVSPSRDTLDVSSLAVEGLLSIPGGALPIGESESVRQKRKTTAKLLTQWLVGVNV